MGLQMKQALERLRAIREQNLVGGGMEQVARQHARGKLTGRERIAALLDPGTFAELGSAVNATGRRIDGRGFDAPCDGAIVGTGLVEGRPVAVYASDFTVLGGSIGTQHGLKFVKLMEMAHRWGIPMVWLLDSSGGRLGYRDVPMAGIDWWFALESRFSGVIPQINVLMGPCIAGQAYCPTLCDFLVMSRGSGHLWLGGPRMTQAATSEKIGEDVGGADYHMILSGTCDLIGNDDADAIAKARTLLGYLPSNFRERPPARETTDPPGRETDALLDLVPDDPEQGYDVHRVIEILVDEGSFFEIKEDYARQIVTGFCRFDGEVTGIVANNPGERGAVLTIHACDKIYRFLQVLDAYHIPLVTLVDTPTAVPGEDQEAVGLLRHMGKVIDTYATASIPKICLVLRDAFADAGGLLLGVGKAMGTDLCLAWPIARFAVECSGMDYAGLGVQGVETDAMERTWMRGREKVSVFDVAKAWTTQIVDEIIAPGETRRRIVEGLRLTRNRTETLPPRAKTCPVGPT